MSTPPSVSAELTCTRRTDTGSKISAPPAVKKQRQKVWHRFKEKKKPLPPLLRLPNEVLWVIFERFFTGVHMIDIKTTRTGSEQRTYGAQSLLFVCKTLRELAEIAIFRFATFDIPHFKLHKKHIRENKMTTLHKIQNLTLLWTPPPSKNFKTIRGDAEYILETVDCLRSIEIWLLATQYLRIGTITEPDKMSRAELHEEMLAKFEPSTQSIPRWLNKLLRHAPQKFPGLEIGLVVFFAFGKFQQTDLHAVYISWPSRSFGKTEIVKWADWARARSGLTTIRIFSRFARILPRNIILSISEYRLTRPHILPHVGEHAFGRKVY